MELSSLEVAVDIAAYLRLEFIAMQSCSRTVKIDANWSFLFLSLSPSRMFSREKKESETISADVLWICWSLGSPSSDALECSQLVIHSCCCCCPFPEK